MRLRIGPSYELRFDPESRRAVSFGRNVSVWDLATGKRTVRAHPLKHPSHVRWSPEGHTLALKSTSGELVLLNADDLECLGRLQSKTAGEGCGIAFSPSGDRLLDGTWNGVLATYELRSFGQQLKAEFPDTMITSIEPSPSRRFAALVLNRKHSAASAAGPRKSVLLAHWAPSEMALHELDLDADGINATAFDNTETRLAVARRRRLGERDRVEIIDLSEKRVVASVDFMSNPNGRSLAWSPDGNIIASVENDGFRFYDSSRLSVIASVGFRYASHVEFSANGRFVALGAWSGGEVRPIESLLSDADAGSTINPD